MLKYNFRGDKLTDITVLQTLQVFFISGRPNMFTFHAYIIAYTKPVRYVKLQKESLTLYMFESLTDLL